MKKILRNNILEIIMIALAPILYIWCKYNFKTMENISVLYEALVLSIIMIMPLGFLMRIIDKIEVTSSKRIIKYILEVLESVLVAPMILIGLNFLNSTTDIVLVKIISILFLSIPGTIALIILIMIFSIISIIMENSYEKHKKVSTWESTWKLIEKIESNTKVK